MIEHSIKELLEAVEDYVANRGDHSGPCTNEDFPDEGYDLHIENSKRRVLRMEEAIKRVRENTFVLTKYDLRFAHFLLGAVVDEYADEDDLIDAEDLMLMSGACVQLLSSSAFLTLSSSPAVSAVHDFLQKNVKNRL